MQVKPTEDIERRFIEVENLTIEIDESREDQPKRITGYAAVFNKLSEDLGGFREMIQPGAFKNSLNGDVRALFNHNSDIILGRTRAGTLTLEEDSHGLLSTITPPDTEQARGIMEAIRRKDITQMSFGFRTVSDNWNMDGKEPIRTLIEAKLYDVSPVTFPAYPQTKVALRSLEEYLKEHGEAVDPQIFLDNYYRSKRLLLVVN